MIRSFALMAATAALVVAPVAAQAAVPARAEAPVTAESDGLRGSPFLLPVVIAVIVGLGIILLTDGDNAQSP